MADMSIAHFGTTLIESAPPEGTDQATIPMTGDLARTHEFLTVLGAEIYIRNMYPGVGRQFIYRRGDIEDQDYFEKDTFTSYTALPVPSADLPRVGETIFRLPHPEARRVASELEAAALIDCHSSLSDFTSGQTDRLFFTGPDGQQYELCESQADQADNHRVYIWTDPSDLENHIAGYLEHFDVTASGTEDFYGQGTAHLLRRETPGITIALVTPNDGELAPKHSFDIFQDAGYSHFRLAAPAKQPVLDAAIEAFPDGGGPVSYVHFQNSYLELVEIGAEV